MAEEEIAVSLCRGRERTLDSPSLLLPERLITEAGQGERWKLILGELILVLMHQRLTTMAVHVCFCAVLCVCMYVCTVWEKDREEDQEEEDEGNKVKRNGDDRSLSSNLQQMSKLLYKDGP